MKYKVGQLVTYKWASHVVNCRVIAVVYREGVKMYEYKVLYNDGREAWIWESYLFPRTRPEIGNLLLALANHKKELNKGDWVWKIGGKEQVKVKIKDIKPPTKEKGIVWYECETEFGTPLWATKDHLVSLKELEGKEYTGYIPDFSSGMSGPTFNISIDKVAQDFMETTVKKVLDSQASVYVAELQKRLQPTIVKIDQKEILIDKTKHHMFNDVLYKCMVHKQVFMSGPTGSGKTTLAAQIAEAMSVPFFFISCSAGMSEAHLLGRMLFNGDYASSDLVKAYEEGGVYLFDEIDAADNNTLLVINSALANNRLSIPNRKDKPYATRHANFVCIVAGNSWGEGSIQYQGRAPLDRAFLDRFSMSKVFIDYDQELEKLITASKPQVSKVFHEFRTFLKGKSIDKPISTRSIISGYKDIENGHTIKQVLKNFITGWTVDETKQADTFINKW